MRFEEALSVMREGKSVTNGRLKKLGFDVRPLNESNVFSLVAVKGFKVQTLTSLINTKDILAEDWEIVHG